MNWFKLLDVDGDVRALVERVLFVDPGIGGTGLAYFEVLPLSDGLSSRAPDTYATFHAMRTSQTWERKVRDICNQFAAFVSTTQPKLIVVEMPEYWNTDAKSNAAIVGKGGDPGDLFKLVYLVGGIGEISHQCHARIKFIRPGDWKGQLPKKVVVARLKRSFGANFPNHAADAVGMGAAAQGVL